MKTEAKTLSKKSSQTSAKRSGGNALEAKGHNLERSNGSSDIYQKFTDLIIEKLENGVIPWKQPWHKMGLPANYLTKKTYKGINLWLLLSYDHQYPYYLTFKQANSLGGKIQPIGTLLLETRRREK